MRPKGMNKQDLEVRRRTAVNLVVRGGMTYRKAAEAVDAVPSSVASWMKSYRRGGDAALAPKSETGKNNDSRLGDRERVRLAEVIKQGACAHGFETDLWTLSRIQKVILREFEVRLSISRIHRVLGEMGFSSQKPERRAREQNAQAVEDFRNKGWLSLGKARGTRGGRLS